MSKSKKKDLPVILITNDDGIMAPGNEAEIEVSGNGRRRTADVQVDLARAYQRVSATSAVKIILVSTNCRAESFVIRLLVYFNCCKYASRSRSSA